MGKVTKGANVTKAKVAKVELAKIAETKALGTPGADAETPFDPQTFLTRAEPGIAISTYRKGQTVFVQGDVADAVFYIQKGRLKAVVLSAQGRGSGGCNSAPGAVLRRGLLEQPPAAYRHDDGDGR